MISTYTLQIIGMTCDHCAKSIEDALGSVAGVVEVKVSYDEGTARIKTDVRVDSAKLIDAVQGKGLARRCWIARVRLSQRGSRRDAGS